MSNIKYRSHIRITFSSLITLVALMLSACAGTATQEVHVSRAPSIEVRGINFQGRFTPDGRIREFLGIPFAQPPVAELRWAAPVQLPTIARQNEKTVAATQFAPACMQGPHLANWYKNVITSFGGDESTFPTPQFSEDCLYLNAWSPTNDGSNNDSSGLPVFVFIHGGSNKGGWSYEPNYLGERLARQGLVVVSIAYRVGALGFFSHPELEHANFGLLDQIAGLKWVQENIAMIGGDPNNITVAGESSGASNIAYLMASPLAKGLFQRAIHQSGGWAMYGTDKKSKDDIKGLELAKVVQDDSSGDAIEKLRQLGSKELLLEVNKVYQDHFFDPVIDGHSVTQAFADVVRNGQLSNVDLMIGSNANESRMYLAKDETIDSWIANNSAKRFPKISKNSITATLDNHQNSLEQLDQLATSYNYTCPSMNLAQEKARTPGQTWFYHFTKQRDGILGAKMGSYHGAELPYVFDTHDDWLPTSEQDKTLTKTLMRYWVNFARSGNPNSVGLPQWHLYKVSGDPVQYLGVDLKSAPHPNAKLCSLFKL